MTNVFFFILDKKIGISVLIASDFNYKNLEFYLKLLTVIIIGLYYAVLVSKVVQGVTEGQRDEDSGQMKGEEPRTPMSAVKIVSCRMDLHLLCCLI